MNKLKKNHEILYFLLLTTGYWLLFTCYSKKAYLCTKNIKDMKRLLFLLMLLTALHGSITAQERFITRGATEGELFFSANWYSNYGPWGDTLYRAFLHITKNGKKADLNYGAEYQLPDTQIADSLPMQVFFVMADATPGVLYNADWCYDKQVYDHTRLWFSDDYGKSWVLRDKHIDRKGYYAENI